MLRAAAAGDTDLVKKLLAQGADIDGTTEGGQTSLMLASISGLSEVVQLLLSAGADAHLKDRLGLSAMDWSKRRGFSEVTDVLGNFGKSERTSTPTTVTEQTAHEFAPETLIKPGIEVFDAPEPSDPPKQEEDGSQKERSRLDQVARIQALFDQLRVGQESFTPEPEPSAEPNASLDDTRTMVPSEEQRLRQERLKAEDERISRAHRIKELHIPMTQPVTLPTSLEQNPLNAEPQSSSLEAERAANELSRENSRLAAERIAEETRRRVEEEVRKKALRHEQEGAKTEPETGQPLDIRPAKARVQKASTERISDEPAKQNKEDVRQTIPTRATRIITQDIWPAQPVMSVARASTSEPIEVGRINFCPKCNAELKGESCPECAKDELSVPTFNSPPQLGVFARPTVWMLMSATLAGGVFIGYQLNEYVSKNAGSTAPLASAPVEPVTPKPEVTPEVPQGLAVVGGALSGAEANVPVPEYPPAAKREGVAGTITVRVRVNNKGRVILARSSLGDWRLRAAAVRAAKQATFLPEKLTTDQRFVSGTIVYTFKP